MNRLLMFFSLTIILFSCVSNSKLKLQSPNKNSESNLTLNENYISLNLIFEGDTLVKKLQLRLTNNDKNLLQNIKIINQEHSIFTESWETVNGKNQTVLNHYNASVFKFKNGADQEFNLEVKMYDEGFAYRFLFPKGFSNVVENSIINFAEDFTFWAYNGEHHNVGPVKLSEYTEKVARNPVVFKTDSEKYFAIHEAAIFEYAPFILSNKKEENAFTLNQVIETNGKAAKTSWRAFILGDKPGDLIESNLLVNLNEPCKIEDVSWIKPGRAMWDWRVWGYVADDGFEYGLNTISHKRFIDFAADNNIQYLLIDADWYGSEFNEKSDPTTTREGVDIVECMAYSKEKNVGVILYLNDIGAKKFGLERVLKQFSEWGAAGVKYGFMTGTAKEKVLNTRRIVELCARYKLIVNFHDNPVPPSGDRRTWPNLITKEFGHSQADAKRSYFPETMVTAPFVNMIAGPLDLCNGWFALNDAFGNGRHKVFEVIPGTVAAEVAKLIVVYGGCFVLPDAPEEYLKKEDLFEAIREMPAHFESYKVIDGEIGEFITVARSSGDEWFVGSLTNREARKIELKLDFLNEDTKYIATLYEDADDTHFLNNKETYQIRKNISVDKTSIMNIKMAPGGGHAIWIRPVK